MDHRAHHLLREGPGGTAKPGIPTLRVHWIATAPCGFGHRTSHTGRCPGRTSSEVRVRGLPRNTLPGLGSVATRPSGQAARFVSIGDPWRLFRLRSGGLRTGYDFTSLASHSSSGGRRTDELESGSSASRSRRHPAFRGLFGVPCWEASTSEGRGATSCCPVLTVGAPFGAHLRMAQLFEHVFRDGIEGCTADGTWRIATWWARITRTLSGAGANGRQPPWEYRGASAPFPKNRSTRFGEVTPGGYLAPRGARLLERETL
jgi:hypothetical protein